MSGKFDSEVDEFVHGLTLDGTSETIGDVQNCHAAETFVEIGEGDEYDRVRHAFAIVAEDSRGFVDVDYFDTQWQAMRAWKARKLVHEQPGGCCADDESEDLEADCECGDMTCEHPAHRSE